MATTEDQSTTLDQLTEKSSFADDDLFLVQDAAGNDQKIKLKPQIDSSINSALTDLSEMKITQKADANLCYPSAYHKIGSFYVPAGSSANTPDVTQNWGIISQRFYLYSTTHNIVQIATLATNPTKLYIRRGYITTTDNTVTYGDWIKMIAESDLTSALSNYIGYIEQTVSCAKGDTTIELQTNGTYIIEASGSNYGRAIFMICQGYNANTTITRIIGSGLTATSTEFKKVVVTNTGDGAINVKVIKH